MADSGRLLQSTLDAEGVERNHTALTNEYARFHASSANDHTEIGAQNAARAPAIDIESVIPSENQLLDSLAAPHAILNQNDKPQENDNGIKKREVSQIGIDHPPFGSFEEALVWQELSENDDTDDDQLSVISDWEIDAFEGNDSANEHKATFLADGTADYPLKRSAPMSIPAHFPEPVVRLIRQLPARLGTYTEVDIQESVVEFLTNMFDPNEPQHMAKFRQLAGLLHLAPLRIAHHIAKSVTAVICTLHMMDSGHGFLLDELLRQHPALRSSRFLSWLGVLSDSTLEQALGVPMTSENILHFFEHVHLRVQHQPPDFLDVFMDISPCKDNRYTPRLSILRVLDFVESLPFVFTEDLAEDNRECGICCMPYGQESDGVVELPVQLPCTHVFGEDCLVHLLGPKPEHWQNWSCPVCRQVIPVLGRNSSNLHTSNN